MKQCGGRAGQDCGADRRPRETVTIRPGQRDLADGLPDTAGANGDRPPRMQASRNVTGPRAGGGRRVSRRGAEPSHGRTLAGPMPGGQGAAPDIGQRQAAQIAAPDPPHPRRRRRGAPPASVAVSPLSTHAFQTTPSANTPAARATHRARVLAREWSGSVPSSFAFPAESAAAESNAPAAQFSSKKRQDVKQRRKRTKSEKLQRPAQNLNQVIRPAEDQKKRPGPAHADVQGQQQMRQPAAAEQRPESGSGTARPTEKETSVAERAARVGGFAGA